VSLNLDFLLMLAQTAGDGDIGRGLVLSLVGVLVVFGALSIILGLVVGLERLSEWMNPTAPTKRPAPSEKSTAGDVVEPAPTAASESAAAPGEPDPALVAVIAAACTAVLHRRVRVRRIMPLGTSQSGHAWVAGGRMTIMGSHRPHMRKPRGAS